MPWPFSDMLEKYLAQIAQAVPAEILNRATGGFTDWLKKFSPSLIEVSGGEVARSKLVAPPIPAQPYGWTPDNMQAGSDAMEAQERDFLYCPIGILGQVKGLLDLGAAGPIQAMVRQFDYKTKFTWPLWLPDAGTLVAAAIKTEGRTGYNKALRLQGLDLWSHLAIEDATRQHLAPADYWRLWRLGEIGQEDYTEKHLSQAGLFKGDRKHVDALNTRWPDLRDLWTARRRGLISQADFTDKIWQIGYDKEHADFWPAVLRIDPPLEALTRGLWLGEIDKDEYLKALLSLGFREEDVSLLLSVSRQVPDLSALFTLWRREIITDTALDEGLKGQGFPAEVAEYMRDLRYISPDPETAITFRRRGLIDDASLLSHFKAAGLRPGHAENMRELVWTIPPVQDLISMAVREAFSPPDIEKFQLHADFPDDFRAWAEKQGLSEFWAKAYWAAHWQLPGIREVFDIFHRIDRATHNPLIDAGTVDQFLKVADISPFWRPLIRQISYEPYTRVDVRRMYQMEIVNEQEVYDTYRDLGYDEQHARALTDWTKKEYRPEKTELTKADILDAYRKGILKREEAASYLKEIGILAVDITFYLARTDYQIEQDKKEATLASMKAMYLADLVTLSDVQQRLRNDNYAEEEIRRIMDLWVVEKEKVEKGKSAKTAKPTVYELSDMLRKGVIDEPTFMQEMSNLGYSQKYALWYKDAAMA